MFNFILLFSLNNRLIWKPRHCIRQKQIRLGNPLSSTNLNNDELYDFCQEAGLELDLKI